MPLCFERRYVELGGHGKGGIFAYIQQRLFALEWVLLPRASSPQKMPVRMLFRLQLPLEHLLKIQVHFYSWVAEIGCGFLTL